MAVAEALWPTAFTAVATGSLDGKLPYLRTVIPFDGNGASGDALCLSMLIATSKFGLGKHRWRSSVAHICLPKRETCSNFEERNPETNRGLRNAYLVNIESWEGRRAKYAEYCEKKTICEPYQLFEGHFRNVSSNLPLRTFKI